MAFLLPVCHYILPQFWITFPVILFSVFDSVARRRLIAKRKQGVPLTRQFLNERDIGGKEMTRQDKHIQRKEDERKKKREREGETVGVRESRENGETEWQRNTQERHK